MRAAMNCQLTHGVSLESGVPASSKICSTEAFLRLDIWLWMFDTKAGQLCATLSVRLRQSAAQTNYACCICHRQPECALLKHPCPQIYGKHSLCVWGHKTVRLALQLCKSQREGAARYAALNLNSANITSSRGQQTSAHCRCSIMLCCGVF